MEAIGRLAGGVAHDFNNALTIIRLSLQLLRRRLHGEDPLWEYVEQIEEASDRAARLTKQLLSFSRREIIDPRVIDLNEVVGNLSRMLQRIIGEDVELVTMLAGQLWPVYIDPAQLEQVIVNLAVNARDAMPFGGTLTIETAMANLDEAYAAGHVDVEPGEYAMLSVSDTGVGMDEAIMEHVFEPFFTTKEPGKGTGLGLATAYGIVKRAEGHIWVYSEVGQGTVFKIYLPRSREVKSAVTQTVERPKPTGGTETILLVEDDDAVRSMATQILTAHGYRVLTARSGAEALEMGRSYEGAIDLLLTDVVLPHRSGRELAEELGSLRPEMRILYMSGYSVSTIAHHGVVDRDVVLLAKPFTVEDLTHKTRVALAKPAGGGSS
jgi:CheY-like chemotaxis protein